MERHFGMPALGIASSLSPAAALGSWCPCNTHGVGHREDVCRDTHTERLCRDTHIYNTCARTHRALRNACTHPLLQDHTVVGEERRETWCKWVGDAAPDTWGGLSTSHTRGKWDGMGCESTSVLLRGGFKHSLPPSYEGFPAMWAQGQVPLALWGCTNLTAHQTSPARQAGISSSFLRCWAEPLQGWLEIGRTPQDTKLPM